MPRATFQPVPQSAKAARDFVRTCIPTGADVDPEIVVLLVSELATNAIVHAGSPFEVWVEILPRCVRVGVDDVSSEVPSLRCAATTDTGGRGLALVDTLAAKWSTEPTSNGKRIWFQVCS